MKRLGKFAIALLALAGVGTGVVYAVDWKALAEQKLVALLQEKGFSDAQLKIKDIGLSSVTLESISLGGAMPLALNSLKVNYSLQELWQRQRLSELTLSGITFTLGDMIATSHETTFVSTPDASGDWKGTWTSKKITVSGLPVIVPETESSGTWQVSPKEILLKGVWGSGDRTYNANFTVNYDLNDPAASGTRLHSFAMPWSGGSIAIRDATIPFAKKAYNLAVMVKAVSVDALLQPLTGNRATATGTVSGSLPFTVNVDGGLTPHTGSLKAESPGKIVMQPDAIPGDNAQIDMLREVMKDFHYSNLAVSVDNDAKNKLSVGLTLEGNNPAAYDGRPVKLNVHLSGDVLDFVQQSMAVSDPQKLLKQVDHAK